MKTFLVLMLVSLPCCAQAQNIERQIVASQFGEFKVQNEGNGFVFDPANCSVSAGGKNFAAFAGGVPVKIVDSNPAHTEITTATGAFITGSYCAVSLATTYTHTSFYLTSGTGGLQEAILNGQVHGQPNTIILDTEWYSLIQPGSAATVISTVQGNTALGLVDVTQTPYVTYAWNGSQYTAVAATLPNASMAGQVPTSIGAGTTYTAQTPPTLPSASTAGQVPTSTGAGTTYTAQTPPTLPSASSALMAPVSTGAGTTYSAVSVPVSFGSGQNQYIQQQVTNANYTTLNVNSLNDEIWVEAFAGGPYTGIGQAQVAWTSGTAEPLCQNVSQGGSNYIAITTPNASVTPGTNVTVWWPTPNTNATNQADCAFATAAGEAAARGLQVTLRAGAGNWNMNGFIEPGGLYSVSIKGCGIFCTTWNYTGSGAVPMVQRGTGGNFTFMQISDAEWQPNGVASSIFDLGALNQSYFNNMQWGDPAPVGTGTSGNFFARLGESGGDSFQAHMTNVTMGNAPTRYNTATITANVVGGSITSYTINNGGTAYPAASATQVYYVQLNGFKSGSSYQPCTVMPVGQTVTVSGGAITAISQGTNSGGSGCSGTVDVAVYTFYPVTWGIYINASDSSFDDITCYASSPSGACFYDNGGDTTFSHIHPSFVANGIETICDGNIFSGTELDNTFNLGFQFLQPFSNPGCAVYGTHSYGNTAPGGNIPYYFASTSSNVTIGASSSLCGAGKPADWHEFVTQLGTIDTPSDWAIKAPTGLSVGQNDLSCGQTMGDYTPTFTTGTLKASTFNPTSLSSQTIYNPPTNTATLSSNYSSSGNFGPQASYCTGSPCAPQTSTATEALAANTGANPSLADYFNIFPCPSNCAFYFQQPVIATSTIQALHYIGYESPGPSIAAGAGAGTSSTVALASFASDLSGYINVTTGTSPTASATIATVTFGTAYGSGVKCFAWPANAAAQALVGVAAAQIFLANITTTTFALTQGSTALAAATLYTWGYTCTN